MKRKPLQHKAMGTRFTTTVETTCPLTEQLVNVEILRVVCNPEFDSVTQHHYSHGGASGNIVAVYYYIERRKLSVDEKARIRASMPPKPIRKDPR